MMAAPLERRRVGQARLPIRVPALTEAISSTRGVGQGEAQNLSAGGLLLRLGHPLRPGDPIQVTLRLSRCPPLVLTGTVAWAQPHSEFSGWALGIMFGEELPGEMVGEIADAEYPPWGPRLHQ
jgi:hypothetical protein